MFNPYQRKGEQEGFSAEVQAKKQQAREESGYTSALGLRNVRLHPPHCIIHLESEDVLHLKPWTCCRIEIFLEENWKETVYFSWLKARESMWGRRSTQGARSWRQPPSVYLSKFQRLYVYLLHIKKGAEYISFNQGIRWSCSCSHENKGSLQPLCGFLLRRNGSLLNIPHMFFFHKEKAMLICLSL